RVLSQIPERFTHLAAMNTVLPEGSDLGEGFMRWRCYVQRLSELDAGKMAITCGADHWPLDGVANKHKVYTSDFPIRDKAAVLVGCAAQEIANFVERSLKEFGISREQLSVIHYLDSAESETMTVNELRETLI